MQKPPLVNNQIYHIYNRGVEKRKVFMDKQDYARFIHDLFEFNDEIPVFNTGRNFKRPMIEVQLPSFGGKNKEKEPRKLLVEIFIFTLMPNHFHLLLKQKKENGIVRFMQKLGTGYTNYFNKKYERVGSLFQGRFKAALVDEHAHFLHLPYYIHSNPLDLAPPTVRSSTSNSWGFLENYKWSSFPDYIGKKNFPSVTQRDFLLDFFGSAEKYEKETREWLKDRKNNLEKLKGVTLD
ncbi:transposase [Patescibacteria group bacterium]|nr:transposase [Patescibacteria group bacterium]